ncbi:MAG: DUF951 domain-containing protein [Bacilli bacterium]
MNNQITFHNGDVLEFKKTHPCGGNNWKLIRVGVDCKLECTTCKRIIIIPRIELPKKIKRFVLHEEIPA